MEISRLVYELQESPKKRARLVGEVPENPRAGLILIESPQNPEKLGFELAFPREVLVH